VPKRSDNPLKVFRLPVIGREIHNQQPTLKIEEDRSVIPTLIVLCEGESDIAKKKRAILHKAIFIENPCKSDKSLPQWTQLNVSDPFSTDINQIFPNEFPHHAKMYLLHREGMKVHDGQVLVPWGTP